MIESALQSAIIKRLDAAPDIWWVNVRGDGFQRGGIPDILMSLGGRFVGLELKTKKGIAARRQRLEIAKIKASGGVAEVIRSVDELDTLIETLREQRTQK